LILLALFNETWAYSQKEIDKLWGLNLLRVLEEVEKISKIL